MRNGLALFVGVMWLATAPPGFAEAVDAPTLVGQAVTEFSLPSQQGKLVQYKKDYYGQHNLILTFFPAAFTPV